jgi:hypothetical protein
MRFVSADLDHTVIVDLHDDAAADTAIRTHASYAVARHNPFPEPQKKDALFSSVEKRGAHGAFVVKRAIGVDCLLKDDCKGQASLMGGSL